MAVHKPGRLIAKKGHKQVWKITSSERGKTVTILCSMNVHGRHIPPFMIFPRKKMNDHLLLGSPPGTVVVPTGSGCTDSGWTDSGRTDSTVFIQWLKHFVDHVKPTPSKKIMLLVDGHVSHKSNEAIEYARANGIEMISFPSHTTHKLQPLDKTYFGQLKQYYGQACDRWMVNHPGIRICFRSIAALFGEAFANASGKKLDKGVAGFSSCGLWPFNPVVFTEGDIAPSMMTDDGTEHVASTSDATSNIQLHARLYLKLSLPRAMQHLLRVQLHARRYLKLSPQRGLQHRLRVQLHARIYLKMSPSRAMRRQHRVTLLHA